MQRATITQSEKQILIGSLLGSLTFILVPILGIIYCITVESVIKETLIIVSVACSIVLIFLLPGVIRLLSDLSSGIVLEGVDEITQQRMSWGSAYSQNIRLKTFGKKKIRIQYKDYSKMIIGKKIKYRISPKSLMLVNFEMQN